MITIKAIIMGILQGLTEFLPVSSSGHLVIFRNIFKLELEGGILFDLILHIGTLLAVFLVYIKDIKELIVEGFGIIYDFLKGKKNIIRNDYRRFVLLIIVASFPTALVGYIIEDMIEGVSLIVPGICLLITATLLLVTPKIKEGKKSAGNMSYLDALSIGTVQGLAAFPGISRSGSTLVCGLMLGLNKVYAIKFSFIMSIPAILGATFYKGIKEFTPEMLRQEVILPYLLGMIASAIVGYFCIIMLLELLKKNKLHYFAYYCYIMGLIAIVGYFIL